MARLLAIVAKATGMVACAAVAAYWLNREMRWFEETNFGSQHFVLVVVVTLASLIAACWTIALANQKDAKRVLLTGAVVLVGAAVGLLIALSLDHGLRYLFHGKANTDIVICVLVWTAVGAGVARLIELPSEKAPPPAEPTLRNDRQFSLRAAVLVMGGVALSLRMLRAGDHLWYLQDCELPSALLWHGGINLLAATVGAFAGGFFWERGGALRGAIAAIVATWVLGYFLLTRVTY